MALTITSPTFPSRGAIPRKHTCDGEGVAPALEWSGVPDGTQSLALIVDDPDAPDPAAPKRTFVHWVIYNIPPTASGLPEGASGRSLPNGTAEGRNDAKGSGYTGPCPPVGRHRYFFHLYALDTRLDRPTEMTRGQVDEAMSGHVLETAELMGTYERTNP
jgi:Raf kinase inhibitor-like YbhB/YbcL family protein